MDREALEKKLEHVIAQREQFRREAEQTVSFYNGQEQLLRGMLEEESAEGAGEDA